MLALGAGAAALLVCGLALATPPAIVASLAGVAASWSVSAWTRGSGAPGGTVLAAAAIFVAAELAYWSLEQVSVRDEGELVARRAAGLALRGAVALAPSGCLRRFRRAKWLRCVARPAQERSVRAVASVNIHGAFVALWRLAPSPFTPVNAGM